MLSTKFLMGIGFQTAILPLHRKEQKNSIIKQFMEALKD